MRLTVHIIVLLSVAAFAYQTGIEQIQSREARLEARIVELETQNETLRDEVAQLDGAAEQVRARHADLLERFNREVPTGILRQLTDIVAQELDDGVHPDRIEMMITAAAQPTECSDGETRRFIVATPLYRGSNTSVAFADGRITVTAEGENVQTTGGTIQGWFDPAKPISVTFTLIGGESSEVTGTLPMQHALLLGDEEYRFTVAEGERSFVNVTADACEVPLSTDAEP